MLYIRSALFNALFYLNTIVLMILGLPLLATSRHSVFFLCKVWGKTTLWLLDKICGTKAEFRGLENIPKGSLIIAPKHQSIWETFALEMFFTDYSIILKRQLMFIPLFGWYLKRAELIAIDRASGKVVDGGDQPVEATEVWTFSRRPGEGWELSAIQQT